MTRNNTSIFELRDGKWKSVKTRAVRPISTVIIKKKEKEALLKDIAAYISPKARVWYANRGFLLQKGYLFYRPPRIGKSSLSLAIAGYFCLDIYIFNLFYVTGQSLGSLFVELPPRCIVLFEDVDAIDLTRFRQAAAKTIDTTKPSAQMPLSKGLSELLNVLDGVMSYEGRLLIITTNHIEYLDPTLIRSGRVDKKIELAFTDKDVIAQLFCLVFKQSEHDIPDHEKPYNDDETVERIANEFANKVPEREFSPAEIQSFLVENRGSARDAVQKVQAWMTRTREERAKRAGSSAGEAVGIYPDESFDTTLHKDRQGLQTFSATLQRTHGRILVRDPDDLAVKDTEAVRAAVHSPVFKPLLSESSSSESVPNTPPPSESDESTYNSK
ncbi:mitochondrial chaperone bcs1 [Niveomyces insectorum RCEF 264]|uniref:Mitochondrial chaperone bcs1 n=1 Tax=Niveomyces insectorum RCEF 264 TaxID=1081102 RepID=A0A162IDY7_9HYPO|nr:mitochondrial chaperone bcs1 [Niveomyces insectorum RCEF 264]